MKVEVDMEVIRRIAQSLITEPNEATWAIGNALETTYPQFRALRHRIIDDFVDSTSIKVGGTD